MSPDLGDSLRSSAELGIKIDRERPEGLQVHQLCNGA